MLSQITINVMSGDTSTCGIHLDGAFRFMNHVKATKSTYSSKARSLHRIYFYLRVIYDSTACRNSCDYNDGSPPSLEADFGTALSVSLLDKVEDEGVGPGKSKSVLNHVTAPKAQQIGEYECVYGVPQALLILLARTTDLIDQVTTSRQRQPNSPSTDFSDQCDQLESDIIDWEPASSSTSDSDTTPSALIIQKTTLAFHSALIIYFAQHIRHLHHNYLRTHILLVISSIEAIEAIKSEKNIFSAPLYWPAFIAGNSGLLAALNSWIKLTDFSIHTFTLITKLRSLWIPTIEALTALNKWEGLIQLTCTIRNPNGDTIASPMVLFNFQSQSLTITLQFDTPPDMDGILKWVLLQVSDAQFDFQDWFSQATTKNFSTPVFRRLVLVADLYEQGGFPTRLDSLTMDLEVGVLFGKTEGQEEDMVFLFTYDWSQQNGSSLQGTLWCPPPDEPAVYRSLLLSYEPCKQFEPATVTPTAPWAGSLDLANLIPNGADHGKIIKIPDGIPSEFSLGFGFGVTMFPQDGSTVVPIELTGAFNYNSGSWSASAAVETPAMQGVRLLNYFDSNTKDDAAALIQHIQLLYLSIVYQYSSGVGSSFQFTGSMGIGELELNLNFNYTSGHPWTITATIDTFPGSTSTLQHILDSIIGDGSVNLPSCVADIKVGDTFGIAEPLLKLTLQGLESNSGTKDGKDVISTLEVNIGVVSFTFLQYRNSSWDIDNNASKRVLLLEVHNLPDFDIPVVGTIPLSQTIEEVCFMWVQDGSKTNVKGQTPGLTKKEIETLNEQVFTTAPLYYKATKEEYVDTDVLIECMPAHSPLMPRALWDSYNPDTDPNIGSKALLNNPGNPIVPLMMSILLVPPEPRLSKDLIQPFDAVASLPQDVFASPPDFPPYTDTANTAWLPIPPTEPPLPDPALPWENVKAAWKTPELGVGAASVMSTAWNDCVGWGVQPPSLTSMRGSKTKTQTSPLVSGAVPDRLVAGLEALYVAAPMMGVAQTV
ncbi:ARG81-like transcription factor [Fusarium denticulatum]|uniref:ARG81-like transcription factor n=1 Tax=Fusarium denticulatum TaxID=48507 RepID=A0A8H5XB98_9HYPO|nr:ARG81-like transcription factor [Fusarium denticulatum]